MAQSKVQMAQEELLRRRAWEDFYVFAKFVAGKNLMEEIPHRELCEFMTLGIEQSEILGIKDIVEPSTPYVKEQKGSLKKLIMLPRNSFKSSVAQALIPWLHWHNPNLRILIDSETLANSKLHLAGIKDLIDNNLMMRKICVNEKGEYLLEPNKRLSGGFVEDQVILKHRSKVGLKEPSIFCSGVDIAKVGMHPDVIIMDDLVSEKNVTTASQIDKVEEHYKFSLSLLEIGGGLQIVIGTRYHMADLYGHLIDSKALDTLIRPAISDEGELYFPTRLTREFLASMRQEQGSHIFHSQYMLSPVNEEDAIFKMEFLHYWGKGEEIEKPEIIDRYITVDPAISQKQTADFSVIMQMGVDKDKRRFVEKYVRAHLTPYQLIDEIFKMAEGCTNLRKLGIETVAFQKALIYMMKDEMRRRGKYLPIVELKADTDKIRRARAVQPAWENGDIYMLRSHVELRKELQEFPFSEHDDTVDSLAYMEQLMKPVMLKNKRSEYIYKPARKVTNY